MKSKESSHTQYAHTRKDGKRDRRFNQSGTKVYKLVFDCVDCGEEFETESNVYVGSSVDRTVQGMREQNPEFAEAADAHAQSAAKLREEIWATDGWAKFVKDGKESCPRCCKTEKGHVIENYGDKDAKCDGDI